MNFDKYLYSDFQSKSVKCTYRVMLNYHTEFKSKHDYSFDKKIFSHSNKITHPPKIAWGNCFKKINT